jgi:hypothetical protein
MSGIYGIRYFSFLTLNTSFIDLKETKIPDVAKVSFYGFDAHILFPIFLGYSFFLSNITFASFWC